MNKSIEELLFFKKSLVAITLFRKLMKNKKIYIYQYYKCINKKMNTSEAFVRNTIKLFEEYGLIQKEKNGRKVFITLTNEGKNLLKDLYKLYKKIQINNKIFGEKHGRRI